MNKFRYMVIICLFSCHLFSQQDQKDVQRDVYVTAASRPNDHTMTTLTKHNVKKEALNATRKEIKRQYNITTDAEAKKHPVYKRVSREIDKSLKYDPSGREVKRTQKVTMWSAFATEQRKKVSKRYKEREIIGYVKGTANAVSNMGNVAGAIKKAASIKGKNDKSVLNPKLEKHLSQKGYKYIGRASTAGLIASGVEIGAEMAQELHEREGVQPAEAKLKFFEEKMEKEVEQLCDETEKNGDTALAKDEEKRQGFSHDSPPVTVIQQTIGLSREDAEAMVDDLKNHNQALAQKVIAEVGDQVIREGQKIRDHLDKAMTEQKAEIEAIRKQQIENTKDIKETKSMVEFLWKKKKEELELEKKRQEDEALLASIVAKREQEEQQFITSMETKKTIIFLTSTILNRGGEKEKKLARDIQKFGSASIKAMVATRKLAQVFEPSITDIFTENTTGKKANKVNLFSAATLVASGNYLAVALEIVNMFNEQPSEHQIVMEQFGKLSKQLADVSKDMHLRFDRVDKKLAEIYSLTSKSYDLLHDIIINQKKMMETLNDIRNDLKVLNEDISNEIQQLGLDIKKIKQEEHTFEVYTKYGDLSTRKLPDIEDEEYKNAEQIFIKDLNGFFSLSSEHAVTRSTQSVYTQNLAKLQEAINNNDYEQLQNFLNLTEFLSENQSLGEQESDQTLMTQVRLSAIFFYVWSNLLKRPLEIAKKLEDGSTTEELEKKLEERLSKNSDSEYSQKQIEDLKKQIQKRKSLETQLKNLGYFNWKQLSLLNQLFDNHQKKHLNIFPPIAPLLPINLKAWSDGAEYFIRAVNNWPYHYLENTTTDGLYRIMYTGDQYKKLLDLFPTDQFLMERFEDYMSTYNELKSKSLTSFDDLWESPFKEEPRDYKSYVAITSEDAFQIKETENWDNNTEIDSVSLPPIQDLLPHYIHQGEDIGLFEFDKILCYEKWTYKYDTGGGTGNNYRTKKVGEVEVFLRIAIKCNESKLNSGEMQEGEQQGQEVQKLQALKLALEELLSFHYKHDNLMGEPSSFIKNNWEKGANLKNYFFDKISKRFTSKYGGNILYPESLKESIESDGSVILGKFIKLYSNDLNQGSRLVVRSKENVKFEVALPNDAEVTVEARNKIEFASDLKIKRPKKNVTIKFGVNKESSGFQGKLFEEIKVLRNQKRSNWLEEVRPLLDKLSIKKELLKQYIHLFYPISGQYITQQSLKQLPDGEMIKKEYESINTGSDTVDIRQSFGKTFPPFFEQSLLRLIKEKAEVPPMLEKTMEQLQILATVYERKSEYTSSVKFKIMKKVNKTKTEVVLESNAPEIDSFKSILDSMDVKAEETNGVFEVFFEETKISASDIRIQMEYLSKSEDIEYVPVWQKYKE
ncbi:hypothetical protein [Candidatus Uabimicrobium amorphum]|uniref:Uncharacterized protein n=1 Tax=Uabimicrobium amorphum TaxID=2596890 RepID=A0A5S9IQF2_UABAM|nr:hypothetical protein [Candidatus Uabimicrobium amorphum]BBM86188.1 hypothetical protein UABAM_04574 [Candidatus Uabimicrobium amorphum]